VKIKAELVDPFVEAGVSVIKELTDIEVRRGHLSFRVTPTPTYEVSIIIGVYGSLTGQVVYSMKKELAVRIVKRMLGEGPVQQFKELFVNTLGELANMITGNATTRLNTRTEHPLKITTPAIVTGKGISINLVSAPTVELGMYTPYGPIEINIALAETGDEQKERSARPPAAAKSGKAGME
jgi:chemotaxis protein CheX